MSYELGVMSYELQSRYKALPCNALQEALPPF